jgi:hypothetical protein
MEQSVELGEPREGKQSMLDRLGVLALVLFNLQCWSVSDGSYCGS